MLNAIDYVKMHGLGNDFVILNQQQLPINYDLKSLAKQISNRHTGIGADQFIVYSKKSGYYEMAIYNQDGSKAKACGNASRCIAKLMNIYFNEKAITLQILDRKVICEMRDDNKISVNMGLPSFNENWMPNFEKIWNIAERYSIEPKEIICVDIGNPHLVIFSNLTYKDKQVIGEALQNNEIFKDGVNVNFASIKANQIYLEVWERGTGFTLACGSGACASFAAAKRLGFIGESAEVVFKLGALQMSENKKTNLGIIMTGDATLVAEGKYYYE